MLPPGQYEYWFMVDGVGAMTQCAQCGSLMRFGPRTASFESDPYVGPHVWVPFPWNHNDTSSWVRRLLVWSSRKKLAISRRFRRPVLMRHGVCLEHFRKRLFARYTACRLRATRRANCSWLLEDYSMSTALSPYRRGVNLFDSFRDDMEELFDKIFSSDGTNN